MKNKNFSRRNFLEKMILGGATLGTISLIPNKLHGFCPNNLTSSSLKTIGIIGLDTSHSEIFAKMINEGELKNRGYKVIVAYPHGSKDIPSALNMKQDIINNIQKLGVEIVNSIPELLSKVDYVLLESNDGKVHLEQAISVFKAKKPVFIDKPLAATLKDVEQIIQYSKQNGTPFFSSSALRYEQNVADVVKGGIGKVTGADVYTPAEIDPGHIDLAWYGIHGVEMLFTIMGQGCKSVRRVHTEGTDILVGTWVDGRIGTVRGIRKGASNIAGIAFGESGIKQLGPFNTYFPLVEKILDFFDTGVAPIQPNETLEIFRFMHAADKSKQLNGKEIII